jgi:hypothetical protein
MAHRPSPPTYIHSTPTPLIPFALSPPTPPPPNRSIDGVTPQAVLLDDPVRLDDVNFWLEYILTHQSADGWLGPDGNVPGGMVYWPRWPVLLTFYQVRRGWWDSN